MCQGKSLGRSVESNLNFIARVLEQVFEHTPDIVCLPEAFTAKGVPTKSVADVAETVPGKTTDTLAKLASKHGCYIICPIYSIRDGVFRNSAVIIDRGGAILGVYDKARPVLSSSNNSVFEEGVIPGDPAEGRFDLDFGSVGVRICMDVEFPSDWKRLADNGVKAVFWPSAYDGGVSLQAQAIMHGFYVISAARTSRARVINPCGRTVAETVPGQSYLISDINLDFALARLEANRSIPDQILAKYGDRVAVHAYPDDDLFLIEPGDNQLSTDQLRAEFGFEPARQFVSRHAEAYERFHRTTETAPNASRSDGGYNH